MINEKNDSRYLINPCLISTDIKAEIIKDLFRMVLYCGAERLDISSRPHLVYLEKSYDKYKKILKYENMVLYLLIYEIINMNPKI